MIHHHSKHHCIVLAMIVAIIPLLFHSAAQAGDEKGVTTPSGLHYIDLVVGTGQEAKAGDMAVVHYTGWLKDGTKFDSSKDRDKPFQFGLGAGQVIKGWDEGVVGMKIGGKAKTDYSSRFRLWSTRSGPSHPSQCDVNV